MFYIFYTNVTKRWEGREADSVFYAYKWVVVGGGGANENKVSMEIRRVLIAKSGGGGGVGLGDKTGFTGFILRERWRCAVVMRVVTDLSGRGGSREGAENKFLRKESKERTAGVSG